MSNENKMLTKQYTLSYNMLYHTETKGLLNIIIRDEEWIMKENMGAFLSVSQGSDQKPKFVEVHYSG